MEWEGRERETHWFQWLTLVSIRWSITAKVYSGKPAMSTLMKIKATVKTDVRTQHFCH